MEEASISEIDHVTIGEGEFFTNCRNNVKSKGLCDVLKFCLVKFAINGADKVFKDQNFRRSNYFIIVLNEEAMLHDNLQAHQYSEKYKFGTNTVLESGRDRWNNEYMNVSKVVNSCSGGIIEFPLNLLAFFAMSMMKFVGFQFNLFLDFVTFPIWLSYYYYESYQIRVGFLLVNVCLFHASRSVSFRVSIWWLFDGIPVREAYSGNRNPEFRLYEN